MPNTTTEIVETIEETVSELPQSSIVPPPVAQPEEINILETTTKSLIDTTSPFVNWIKSLITWDNLFKFLTIAILIVGLWFLYKIIVKAVKKAKIPKFDDHKKDITIRFIKYLFYLVIIVQILGFFGINLSALWGAAGIAGVALGFAAQTSVSNIISGLFVLTEGSLKIGDKIQIDDIEGIVESINLLSVRIHTLDNQMVRIPNSTIIDSNLMNISYHKIRRFKVLVSISYNADMEKALEILSKAPELCPSVLKDPAPAAWFDSFGDSGINMVLAVWFKGDNITQTKNEIFIAVKKVFDEAKIEIPFNQLDVKIKSN